MDKALEEVVGAAMRVMDWEDIPHINAEESGAEESYIGTLDERRFVVARTSRQLSPALGTRLDNYAFFVRQGNKYEGNTYTELLNPPTGEVLQHTSNEWIKEIYATARAVAEENVWPGLD